MLTVVAFLVLLGVLITVHEAGHFFVAKACGVRVLTFSIGFGPKLVGFTRGETEYRIGILPLGGYVRMYGDDANEEIPPEEQSRAFLTQPFLKKSAIAIAGPVANVLLPLVLFFGLTIGHERVPDAVVATVVPGEAAAQAGLLAGDRIVAVNGTSIALWTDLQAQIAPRAGVTVHMTIERDHKRFDVEVTPRAAAAPTIFERTKKVGRLGVMSSVELPLVLVDHQSPASHAGIHDRDRVNAVDGIAVHTKAELFAALDAAAAHGTATLDVETAADGAAPSPLGDTPRAPARKRTVTLTAAPALDADVAVLEFAVPKREQSAEPVAMVITRTRDAVAAARAETARRFGLAPIDGRVALVVENTVAAQRGIAVDRDRIVAVDGKPLVTANDLQTPLEAEPDAIHVVGVVGASGARVIAFRMLPATERQMGGQKVFGVALSAALEDGPMVDRTVSPAEALHRAVDLTEEIVLDVLRGFALLVNGNVGLQALSGPISIAQLSGQAASAGASSFVKLMALISVNLAVINLMPIPVLDGGHLLFFTIELFTRKKVTTETRRKATLIGVVLVGLLMIVAVTNDVLGLFGP